MNISISNKNKFIKMERIKIIKRSFMGRESKLGTSEMKQEVNRLSVKRTNHENKYLENYERIYPLNTRERI